MRQLPKMLCNSSLIKHYKSRKTINNYDNNDHVFKGMNKSGVILPQGTYFYLVQFDMDGQRQRKAGYFVLKY